MNLAEDVLSHAKQTDLQAAFDEAIQGTEFHREGVSDAGRLLIKGISEPPLLVCDRKGLQISVRIYFVNVSHADYERVYLAREGGFEQTLPEDAQLRTSTEVAEEAIHCLLGSSETVVN